MSLLEYLVYGWLTLFFVNVIGFHFLRAKFSYFCVDFLGVEVYANRKVFVPALFPVINLILLTGMILEAGRLVNEKRIQMQQKQKKLIVLQENPHLAVIEKFLELEKMYLTWFNHYEFNGFCIELKNTQEIVLENKNNEAMIYLLKGYGDSIAELLEVLTEAKKLSKEKEKEIFKSSIKNILKFTEEVQNFQQKLNDFQQQTEERTFEKLTLKVEQNNNQQTGSMFDEYLANLAVLSQLDKPENKTKKRL